MALLGRQCPTSINLVYEVSTAASLGDNDLKTSQQRHYTRLLLFWQIWRQKR